LAFVFIIIIFLWLQSRELQTAWGDVRSGIYMAMIRTGLANLKRKKTTKTWRPSPIVLSGAPTSRWHLIDFANSIIHHRGILTVATVLTSEHLVSDRLRKIEKNIEDFLLKRQTQGFARVISAQNPFKGSVEFVKSYGFGSLTPNTIILGDTENPDHMENYCEMISQFHQLNRNVVIVRDNKNKGFGDRQKIDLWWGGLKANSGLLMILSYLLSTSRAWYGAEVTVKMIVKNETAAVDAKRNLTALVKKLRTGAKLDVIVSNGRTIDEVMHESSSNADLIFMGMAKPSKDFVTYYKNLQSRIHKLPTTILVLAAQDISFGEVLLQQDVFRND
jgi:hypothetical protein